MSTPVIDIQGLTRRYGTRRGVDDVHLAIPEGALYGFLGPNGAGKTTTIRVLLGFLRPTGGSARVLGMDCWHQSAAIKHEVGAIPGDLRLWPWLNGLSALTLFGRIRGRDMLTQGRALAEELELDLSVRVRQMSRGMRQKLGLILALAHAPRVLVLDEPTTALDPLMQERLRRILRRMAQSGHTVFFSSHTLAEVEELCERVAIVRAGRIVADTTLQRLKQDAGHDVEIHWTAHAGERPQPPGFIALREVTPALWTGTIREPVGPLLEFAHAHRDMIQDIKIARPDLEQLFRRFYEDDAPGAASAPDTHGGSR